MGAVSIGRRTLLGGAALLSGFGADRAEASSAPFSRGVALSSWFSNAPRQPLFERDFAQIAATGFDHVRLTVDPELIGYKSASAAALWHPDPKAVHWGHVDTAVQLAGAHGLAVVFDIHPDTDYQARLEVQPWIADDLVAFVAFVAGRYSGLAPDRMAIEVLNEPQFYHAPAVYHALAARLLKAVRAAMPRHPVLIGGPFGSSIRGLQTMPSFGDPNVIYTFHYYQPYIVTHQGINLGFEGTQIRAFHDVPYPASAVDLSTDYAPAATSPGQARRELRQYVSEGWQESRVLDAIRPAADWAASHQAKVMCTEFGAYRAFIDPASRYGWIGDVREALEKCGIGWTIWDYADLFGITVPVGRTETDPVDHAVTLLDPEHGSRRFEPAALRALGLVAG